MAEALVKGETHISRKDKQYLLNLDYSEFDAVFREGYDKNYFERELTFPYLLFVIGHLVYGGTYGRLYFSSEEIKKEVEEGDASYFDRIDIPIYKVFSSTPRWKRFLFVPLSPFLALIIMSLLVYPIILGLSSVLPEFSSIFEFTGGLAVILFFSLFWAFALFLFVEISAKQRRDEWMAEEIIRISEENGFENVMVSCGGKHRPSIASDLREAGWEVQEEPTDSPIGKTLLWVDRIERALLSLIRWIRKRVTQISKRW